MAKRKTHKEDRRGWPLFNRLLAGYIELTRFPELPELPESSESDEEFAAPILSLSLSQTGSLMPLLRLLLVMVRGWLFFAAVSS